MTVLTVQRPWLAHHLPAVVTTAGVLCVAADLAGWPWWLFASVVGVALYCVAYGAFYSHNHRDCLACALLVPGDGERMARRDRRWLLWVFHLGVRRMFLPCAVLVVAVGGWLVGSFAAPGWLVLVVVAHADRWHARLERWCPFCETDPKRHPSGELVRR